jgi:crotonobetainyl-CoA:carnitine CoA-transferase CaiB-like acyl-CoA transferase
MTKDEFHRGARSDTPGPLAGVRVLEATTTWAGPMCAAVLGDLGADVIKVELPGGEVGRYLTPLLPRTKTSFIHATVNRNKRSLTLDVRVSRTPTRVRTGAPALGQHNEEILVELGFDAAARRKLSASGIV